MNLQTRDSCVALRFCSSCFTAAVLSCFFAQPVGAQLADPGESDPVDVEEELGNQNTDVDESTGDAADPVDVNEELGDQDIDVDGSISDAEERRGFGLDGDVRLGFLFAGDDFNDFNLGDSGTLRSRWRVRSIFGITERFRGAMRIAGICSGENCSPDFIFQPELPNPASIGDGQITIDSLFLQWFRSDRFDILVGRMETKFVARGGVYSKSLDRNDSNNLRVNWTDGLQTTFKAKNGWKSNLILQYNSADGAGNIRRDPLDFSDRRSRVSYFLGFESVQPKRRLVQRGFDITYMPASLLVTGQTSGPVKDYWAVVARSAGRWPTRPDGWRIRIATELGYASNTQSKSAAGITGSGDASGLAWNITASLMDFVPGHSIGINFAKTEAGWLLSPQYTDNEQLFEIRYMWRPSERLTLDVRGRWRNDLRERIIEIPARDRFDFYARFTWIFNIRSH